MFHTAPGIRRGLLLPLLLIAAALVPGSAAGQDEVTIGTSRHGVSLVDLALPKFLNPGADPATGQVIDELRGASRQISKIRLGEDLVATTVCRHAVKANDLLHPKELEKLLRDLLVCEMPYCCPHGRPTLIQIGYPELERKFGRRT